MRVVVTGGSGYIAGFVIAEFLNHGYEVRASLRDLARLDSVKAELDGFVAPETLDRLTAFRADLTSPDGWADGMAGCDGVIHVASPLETNESTAQLTAVTEGGTRHVLEAAVAVGVPRAVMTSSLVAAVPVISDSSVLIDETCWTDAASVTARAYQSAKLAAEKAAWAIAQQSGLQLSTVLPGYAFGPIMNKAVISTNSILLGLLSGQLHASLNVVFEMTDVRDMATLHRLVFEAQPAVGQRFIASSQVISMPQIAKIFREQYPQSKTPSGVYSSVMARLLAVFYPAIRGLLPLLSRNDRHTAAKAESMLGWTQHAPAETMVDAARDLVRLGLISV
jgi:nucleoside-diphosphate-sugar epimerase